MACNKAIFVGCNFNTGQMSYNILLEQYLKANNIPQNNLNACLTEREEEKKEKKIKGCSFINGKC